MKKAGKCKVCGIVTWKDLENKPKVFPCGVGKCPYERWPCTLFQANRCLVMGRIRND
jgi:hypothetical protein